MIELWIGGRDQAEAWLRPGGPPVRHVLSIADPGEGPPVGLDTHRARRLCLEFHDLEREIPFLPQYVPPTEGDVARILEFGRGVAGSLLVHCAAGISRSTASALLIVAQALGPGREREALDRVLEARPQALPNHRIVRFGDAMLGLDGRLVRVVECRLARG